MNPIPPMTDPLGKYWNQPDSTGFLFDHTHVLMELKDFIQLSEYSTSTPTGVYEGKMWVSKVHTLGGDKWYLRWYDISDKPNCCNIHSREILIT